MKNEFDAITIKRYQCEKGLRLFDEIRNSFLVITPEEIVRQKMVQYLMQKMKVSKNSIFVEDDLVHYGVENIKGRIDIAILNDAGQPLAVVECKAETVSILAEQVYEQAVNYARNIGAPYIILVNGIELQFFHLNQEMNTYIEITEILTYQEMLEGEFEEQNCEETFKRLNYSQYFDLEFLKGQEWYSQKIGEDTSERLVPFIINLDDCLLDCDHKMKTLSCSYLEIIDDLGIQYRNYGDASGGGFGCGYYRVLFVKDKNKDVSFLVGFSIIATGKTINDPVYGNTNGKSVLVVFQNDGDVDEISVQINLNKFISIDGLKAELSHNGVVTRKGATKNALLRYVEEKATYLVDKNKVVFGTIDFSKYLYLDNIDVMDCFTRIIEYSIYRDEFKHNCN